jgi:alpha-mannosidase
VTLEAPALAGWQAARVDLLERNPAGLDGREGRWQLDLRPWEIATIAFREG